MSILFDKLSLLLMTQAVSAAILSRCGFPGPSVTPGSRRGVSGALAIAGPLRRTALLKLLPTGVPLTRCAVPGTSALLLLGSSAGRFRTVADESGLLPVVTLLPMTAAVFLIPAFTAPSML